MKLKQLSCFHYLNWNPGGKELRSFALAMLVGFAVIGLMVAWRHGGVDRASLILWGVGAGLAIAAVIPGLGRIAYLAVYVPTSILGHFLSQAILGLMFALVFVPIALLLRLMGKDLLRLRRLPVWVRARSLGSSYYNQF